MDLKSLMSDSKEIEAEFPGMEGFKVKLVYLSKEQLRKIMDKSKTIGFDRKTREPTEEMDDKLFTKYYVTSALVGWTGLKYEYLKDLVLINPATLPEEGELEYTVESAIELVSNAKDFDAWLTATISDISLFNRGS